MRPFDIRHGDRRVLSSLKLYSSSSPPSPPLSSNFGAFVSTARYPLRRNRGIVVISSFRPITCTMAAASASKEEDSRPIGVLFVCWGNICRSPTAEAIFRYAVEKRGLESYFNIDSAGTIDYHEGEPADARMKAAAIKRGVQITSISRPIQSSDFEKFDVILAMDKKNKEDILKAHKQWNTKQALPPDSDKKVKLMCEYCTRYEEMEVPDPYYGGAAGFEKVLDLLEDACESLLDSLATSIEKKTSRKLER